MKTSLITKPSRGAKYNFIKMIKKNNTINKLFSFINHILPNKKNKYFFFFCFIVEEKYF